MTLVLTNTQITGLKNKQECKQNAENILFVRAMLPLQAHGHDDNVFSKLCSLGLKYTENISKQSRMLLFLTGPCLFIHTSLSITKHLQNTVG